MAQDYSNYDMLDKLLSNERKAKSWTICWITLLCLLSGLVIWMAVHMNQQNRRLQEQYDIIKAQNEKLENQRDTISDKNALIKSMEEDCNRDKTRMTDSFKTAATAALASIVKTEQSHPPVSGQRDTGAIKRAQETTIRNLDVKLAQISKAFQKDKPRLFIQYNNQNDLAKINKLMLQLKTEDNFVVPPPELIQTRFPYLVKCYNFNDAVQEKHITELLARFLDIPPGTFKISHDTRAGMHASIELWIGSPNFVAPVRKVVPADFKN